MCPVEMDPLDELIREAVVAFEQGEYLREADGWKKVVVQDPDNPHWHSNLACALANAGETFQAEILFQYAMSLVPPPSAAFNNYVVMHAELGTPPSEMLPFLVMSIESSETYEHFQRHLLNVCAAFALADQPATPSVWGNIRERAVAILERNDDYTDEHKSFVDDCVLMFGKYDPFKRALVEQDLETAESVLGLLREEFERWTYGRHEVNRIQHIVPLLAGARQLFSVLRALGSGSHYGRNDFHQAVSQAFASMRALANAAGMYGSRTFLDLLGWSAAELHRQSQWLVRPAGTYDAEAHATPKAELMMLSSTVYSELGEMLQALLLGNNRTIRRAAQQYSIARTPEERSEILERAWRGIRANAHGVIDEYRGLSECLGREMLGWNTTPRDRLAIDIERFRSFVEARVHSDFYVNGKPQEQVGRAVLLAFLRDRGFSEVPLRGGRADILVVRRDSSFVIELKVWRGPQYHDDGIEELREYVANNSVPDLAGAIYVVLDPTESGRAAEYVKQSAKPNDLEVVVVSIRPPVPSKKGSRKRSR